MATVNVYVSAELQARMEDFKGENVNWSQIAQRAFESKICELGANKREGGMQEMVDRLKKSRAESVDGDQKAGRSAGVEWAEKSAEYRQLKALEKIELKNSSLQPGEDYGHYLAEQILAGIGGPEPFGYPEVQECYEGLFGEAHNLSRAYVQGFVLGALERWKAVKDQVE